MPSINNYFRMNTDEVHVTNDGELYQQWIGDEAHLGQNYQYTSTDNEGEPEP